MEKKNFWNRTKEENLAKFEKELSTGKVVIVDIVSFDKPGTDEPHFHIKMMQADTNNSIYFLRGTAIGSLQMIGWSIPKRQMDLRDFKLGYVFPEKCKLYKFEQELLIGDKPANWMVDSKGELRLPLGNRNNQYAIGDNNSPVYQEVRMDIDGSKESVIVKKRFISEDDMLQLLQNVKENITSDEPKITEGNKVDLG